MIIPDIRITACLEPGAVFYFKEESFENSNTPHYFILLNNNPKFDEVLVLVYATSKVEKVKQRRRNCPKQTLIDIMPEDYRDFTLPTIIDCNTVIELNPLKLIEKLENKELRICEKMPFKHFNLIKSGVLTSRMVEGRIKKSLL